MLFKAKKQEISRNDSAFMSDIHESLLAQTTPGSMLVLYMVMLVLGGGLIWAHFARVEEITRGEAKVISKGREQVIQSLEGGILASMKVHEGDIVERGQPLLQMDPTRAQSSFQEVRRKAIGLKATIARLRAEAFDIPLEFDNEVLSVPREVELETSAYRSRKKSQDASVGALQKSYELSMREIALAEPLAGRGLMSEVELLRMRRQANDLLSQIADRKNRFQSEANTELTKLELELAQTTESLVGRADVVERTTITAPLRGTVKNIRVSTIGGVIQPGERILEIIPLEDQLLVEAQIRPSDVAFLHPGLKATVKITAYDYAIYGGLTGQIETISPDTLKDDQKAAAGRPDAIYYRVMILTDKSSLEAGGKALPIIPGMVANVEIKTGEKTILDYLLKPVFKAREAFRER